MTDTPPPHITSRDRSNCCAHNDYPCLGHRSFEAGYQAGLDHGLDIVVENATLRAQLDMRLQGPWS